MVILRKLEELETLLDKLKKTTHSIGFVPTMGALHQGHISLVEASKKENEFTLVSVFVNPTQFNNADDLLKYPRTEEADAKLLAAAGVDAVFFPSVEMIYPNGQKSDNFEFDGLENQMEGKFRPGHFDGVGTVVNRFFEMIQPTKAYFGEKDFQQLRIIQHLVESNKLNLQIVPVPIKREKDGLAMSSRNMRLSEEMRAEAPKIYQILKEAKSFFQQNSVADTKEFVEQKFNETKLELEYFEIADEQTLISIVEKKDHHKIRAFVAVFAGEIRLIDNLAF